MKLTQIKKCALFRFFMRHIGVIAVVVFLFSTRWFLHISYMPQDYSVETEITSFLKRDGIYYPGGYFSDAEQICFLDPYWTPERINVPLSESARFELNLKINGILGTDDSIWWLIGIKNKNVKFIYKMRTWALLRFPKNKTVCVNAKKIMLKLVESEKYPYFNGVYFEIIDNE